MQLKAGTCFLCEQDIYTEAPQPMAAQYYAAKRMHQHIMEEHTEIERARFKLRQQLETLNPGVRASVARDVYTALQNDSDKVGCYSIDEALGSVTIHYFYMEAQRKLQAEVWVSGNIQPEQALLP